MTNVEITDSLKYGLVLFGYFLGVTLVGGGGMVLGGSLVAPEVQSWLSSGDYAIAELAGGAVLTVLGVTVWITGNFGIAYKLLSDSVAEGVSMGQGEVSVDFPDELQVQTVEKTGTETGPTGPSPGEQAARQHGADQTVPSASGRETGKTATPQERTGGRTETGVAEGETDKPDGPRSKTADRDGTTVADRGKEREEKPANAEHADDDWGGEWESGSETAGEPVDRDTPEETTVPSSRADASEKPDDGTERTAEEIAFGADREQSSEDTATEARPKEPSPDVKTGNDAPSEQTDDEGNIPPFDQISEEARATDGTEREGNDAEGSLSGGDEHDVGTTTPETTTAVEDGPENTENADDDTRTGSIADEESEQSEADQESEQSEADQESDGDSPDGTGDDSGSDPLSDPFE